MVRRITKERNFIVHEMLKGLGNQYSPGVG